MKARTAPRVLPDNSRFFTIEVEGLGLTQWRLPLPMYAALWQTHMVQSGIIELGAELRAVREGDGEAEAKKAGELAVIGQHVNESIDLHLLGGAAIGLCWYGRDSDIEATLRGHARDYFAFGESVLLELHEHGWTERQMATVWGALTSRLNESLTSKEDATAREDFSEAGKAESS